MTNKLKILICAHDRPNSVNGPNVWLQRLLPELRNEGIDAGLLFFPVGDPGQCPTLQALKSKGFQCEIYSGLKYTEHKMKWILEQVNKQTPDIFMPNLNIPAYYASKYIKKTGIPTVGMLHSDDSFYRSIVDEFIVKPTESFLSAIICVSGFLEDFCRDRCESKTIIRKIPYGVPVPERKAGFDNNRFKLMYAGRFIERQKRISDVTKSLCELTSKVPGTEAVLYGSGPSEPEIKQILAENKEANVKLGGLVNSEELQKRFLENQVFVLLSDYEGLPIALMESMAAGLVPVCYKMDSGIPELVTDGVNGLIVNDRNQSFYSAIKRLTSEEGLWATLSGGARKKIERGYSIPYMKKEWRHLLIELYKQSNRRKKKLEIPHKFNLPPRNPSIRKYEDTRWPGFIRHNKARVSNLFRRISGMQG